MAEAPTDEELASQAGFTVAFFKSNGELWSIFKKALAEDYAPDRLLMEMRNTNWFKQTSQTQREALLLKTSDPKTYAQQAAQMLAHVQQIARDVGIPLGKATGQALAAQAYTMGWTDEQIRRRLGEMGSVFSASMAGTSLSGDVGAAQGRIKEALGAYGITVTKNSEAAWLSGIAQGAWDESYVMNEIRRVAKAAYPGIAQRIDDGETVADIARPYVESMSEILEVPPDSISMRDRDIRAALSARDKKGKWVMKTVPEFEEGLKRDPRWNKTANARESMMSTGLEVLKQMGVVA